MKVNWKQLVQTVLPMVLAQTPKIQDHPEVIPIVMHGVLEAEDLFGKGSGAEKAAHATNLLTDSLNTINSAVKPLPVPELVDAARKGVDTGLATVKAIEALHVAQPAA